MHSIAQDHGGASFAALQTLGPGACDFSSNVNPWGCSPRVRQALSTVPISHYPDRDCRELRGALAAHEGVPGDTIICGNGSSELIRALCYWLEPGTVVSFPEPTFGEYRAAAATARLQIAAHDFRSHPGLQCVIDEFIRFVRAHGPGLVFLCSPNNPTGQGLPPADLERLADACEPGILVVDQAYREYTPEVGGPLSPRILRLCSLTKAYGLAGLRLGYLVGPASILSGIGRYLPPWSVSAAAQTAGVAALRDQRWLQETVDRRADAAAVLRQLLSASGFEIRTEGAGFLTLRVGRAAAWRDQLLTDGLVVRDCTSFGLPDTLRLSPGPVDACRRLVEAMVKIREGM